MPHDVTDGYMKKAETEDGLMSFNRSADGNTVIFTLNYGDGEQSMAVEQTRDSITQAVDALRDKAIDAMRQVIEGLSSDLCAQLSKEGRKDDFVDPDFTPAGTEAESTIHEGQLTVRIKTRYLATITDSNALGHADSFLAEEYVRSILRRRTTQLMEIFEEIRRDLLSGLSEDT